MSKWPVYGPDLGQGPSMGEYEEMYAGPDVAMDDRPVPRRTVHWTTKDRNKIRVMDMATSHLVNTIAFLVRAAVIKREHDIAMAYSASTLIHGEMASDAIEFEITQLEASSHQDFLPPIFWTMRKELISKRGITEAEVDATMAYSYQQAQQYVIRAITQAVTKAGPFKPKGVK